MSFLSLSVRGLVPKHSHELPFSHSMTSDFVYFFQKTDPQNVEIQVRQSVFELNRAH